MQVIQADYTTQVLKLQLPGDPRHWGKLSARVKVTQPSGYALEMDGDLQVDGKRAEVRVRYPLMDDGAWEQIEGRASSLHYEMGVTTFEVSILNDGSPIVTESADLDQDAFYANSGKGRLRHDFPPGFIECAPLRPVCVDYDEIPLTIRLKTERVPACRVRIDVTERKGSESLVEPVDLDLTEARQTLTFNHAGWDRGEYWIRIRLLEGGRPFGPCMVRKFWKEVIGPDVQPEPPLRLGQSLQYMVDDWLLEASEGIDFWPMSYDPGRNGPAIVKDKPWEFEMMWTTSTAFDESEGLFKMEYGFERAMYRPHAFRKAFGWHVLADDLASSEDETGSKAPSGQWIQGDETLPITLRRTSASGEKTDPLGTGYGKLLRRLLDAGTSVKEFDYDGTPFDHGYAILNDPRPEAERNTDHLMLAVPGVLPGGRLPPPEGIDESAAEVFELYPEDLQRPQYVCLATSKDGIHWEKPELGRVEFHGSKANNILGTFEDLTRTEPPKDVTSAITLGVNASNYRFGVYDPERDGPVDMDRVFMGFIAGGHNPKVDFAWPDDFEASRETLGFRPVAESYYPMVYKGDNEYQFLSNRPLIHLGPGMDLMHSSETIRHQVELRDKSTVFWYYRPNSPPYPPQCMPWDNHQGPLRHLAVIWTDDGIHFHKRFCVGTDEFDPLGMQFYNMGMIVNLPAAEQGRSVLSTTATAGVAVDSGEVYVAELRSYPTDHLIQYPELMWSRDLLHWHRFTHRRAPLVKPGEENSDFPYIMYFQSRSYLPAKDDEGNDVWLLRNEARNAHHNHTTATRYPTLAAFQARFPHYSETPFFVSWENLWRHGMSNCSFPMFTRIRPGRLAYAAPLDVAGELTTHPIRFDGADLLVNAQVESGGRIRVELQGEDGTPVRGYTLEDSDPLFGDEVDHKPSWSGRRLSEHSGRVLKFRLALEKARLFTLQIR